MSNNDFNPFLKGLMTGPKIEDLDQLTCQTCDNIIFQQYYKMYKLSALKSPTGKSQAFNVPVFACANCGEIFDTKKAENNVEDKSNP